MQSGASLINDYLASLGMTGALATAAMYVIVTFILAALSWLSYVFARKFLIQGIEIFIKKTSFSWDDVLLEYRVFHKLSCIAPAVILYIGIPVFLDSSLVIRGILLRVVNSYIAVIAVLVLDSLMNAGLRFYQKSGLSKDRPIKSYVQVVKLFLYLIAAIIIISTLMAKSPWVLLSGLGAMTAVLMLVFKDSILGFVASIQIAVNDLLRVGDWIEMPSCGADGDVIDISLNTVKVQNWDKTISSIPTYSLISGSFKNWRGMSESGGRRIKRSISVDMTSVKFCTPEMIEKFRKIDSLKDYIDRKLKEVELYNEEHRIDTSEIVNGRRLTNLGTFRAYIEAYLRDHSKVHEGMTLIVRQLQPGPEGVPIEIYIFLNDQVWSNYESIQSDIFDHILAVVGEFGLKVFQKPTGADFERMRG